MCIRIGLSVRVYLCVYIYIYICIETCEYVHGAKLYRIAGNAHEGGSLRAWRLELVVMASWHLDCGFGV